jgi:hypothetical protein
MPPSRTALSIIIDVFDRLGIRYLLGGSVASSLHGVPRATMDVDILADIRGPHAQDLERELKGHFGVFADEIRDAVARRRAFNLIHTASVNKIDIFLPAHPFHYSELARGRMMTFEYLGERVTAPVATPEDILLAKLVWYRQGGEISEQQWRDIQGVATTQQNQLDRAYLQEWAATLGITDLLAKL